MLFRTFRARSIKRIASRRFDGRTTKLKTREERKRCSNGSSIIMHMIRVSSGQSGLSCFQARMPLCARCSIRLLAECGRSVHICSLQALFGTDGITFYRGCIMNIPIRQPTTCQQLPTWSTKRVWTPPRIAEDGRSPETFPTTWTRNPVTSAESPEPGSCSRLLVEACLWPSFTTPQHEVGNVVARELPHALPPIRCASLLHASLSEECRTSLGSPCVPQSPWDRHDRPCLSCRQARFRLVAVSIVGKPLLKKCVTYTSPASCGNSSGSRTQPRVLAGGGVEHVCVCNDRGGPTYVLSILEQGLPTTARGWKISLEVLLAGARV